MDLVSFKAFLKPGKPTAPDFLRFLRMLLQGISTHVVEGDTDDLVAYREETGALADQITETSSSEDILLVTTGALRALEEYNRRTKRFVGAQSGELKTALRNMTETITVLTQSRGESIQQLTAIERRLAQASAIEDIRLLRVKLQDCLTMIREESVRLRNESEARLNALQQKIETVFSADGGINPGLIAIDPVTGLENHAAAEKVIAERVANGRPCVTALFLVNKLAMVNRRFGRTVGDEVLEMVALHIAKLLPPNSVLFRWSGPALAAVVEVQSNFDEVNRKLSKIASAQLEKNIDTGDRSVFVPVSILLFVQKAGAASVPDDVCKAMDQFVSANTTEEQPVGV